MKARQKRQSVALISISAMNKLPFLQRVSKIFISKLTEQEQEKSFHRSNAPPFNSQDSTWTSLDIPSQASRPLPRITRLLLSTASESNIKAQTASRFCQLPTELFDQILQYISVVDVGCLLLTCKSLYSYGCRRRLPDHLDQSDGTTTTLNAFLDRLSRNSPNWQACHHCVKLHTLVPSDEDQNTSFSGRGRYPACDKQVTVATICRKHQQNISLWQKHLLVKGQDYYGIPKLPISALGHDCHEFECATRSEKSNLGHCLSVKSSGSVQRGFLLLKLEYLAEFKKCDTWDERQRELSGMLGTLPTCKRIETSIKMMILCQLDHLNPCQDRPSVMDYARCNRTEYGCSRLQRCQNCRSEAQITEVRGEDHRFVARFVAFKNVGQGPGRSNWHIPCDPKDTYWTGYPHRQQPDLLPHMTLKDLFDGNVSPRFQSNVHIV